MIQQLQERIQELEARLGKDSRNSSKPPSSDGFKRRRYSKRQPSTRPTGGQPGHEGQTLQRSEMPDKIVIHRPEVCQDCHTALQNIPEDERNGWIEQYFEQIRLGYQQIPPIPFALSCD